jgi:AcrR family transcriptional regulator
MSPVTRKEKQARTRAKLLSSASKLFCRHGLEQSSVDDIARDAGFTKGAFYSNFKSKEELFLAMLDERFAEEIERIEAALGTDESPEETARHAGEELIRFLRSDPEWERLYMEFIAHAGRNEGFRQELLTRCRAMDAQLEHVYRRWNEQTGLEPPIPLEDVTQITSIMHHGFLVSQQIDPELREDLYGTMLAAFIIGMREMRRQQNPEEVRRAEERLEV